MRDKLEHLETGKWGEKTAARFLKEKGFKIIGRRVTVGRRDEIDLVARDGRCLVFVEVKTRATERYGRPSTAVDRAKRHTLSRAAIRYLQAVKAKPVDFRFDVVEIVGIFGGPDPLIRHIENAFPLESRYSLPW